MKSTNLGIFASSPIVPIMDYYQLLGINKDASNDDIRKAYKEIARIYHPDSNFYDEILDSRNSISQDANQRFKEITEAYNILSNPEKRREYDINNAPRFVDWSENTQENFHSSYGEKNFFQADKKEEQRREEKSRRVSEAYGIFGMNGIKKIESALDEEMEKHFTRQSSAIRKRLKKSWIKRLLKRFGF